MGRLAHSQGAGQPKGDTGPASGMRFPGPVATMWLGRRSAASPPRPGPSDCGRSLGNGAFSGNGSAHSLQALKGISLLFSCQMGSLRAGEIRAAHFHLLRFPNERGKCVSYYGRRGWRRRAGAMQRTAGGGEAASSSKCPLSSVAVVEMGWTLFIDFSKRSSRAQARGRSTSSKL